MADFIIARSTSIAADPARVHALINNFEQWVLWSPWEGLDPELTREYTGPSAGVGAHYRWEGNRKAGQGSMEITESTPEKIVLALEFVKPFKASNVTTFVITSDGTMTDVAWTMTGARPALMALMAKIIPFDKMISKDFDKGLAALKQAAEG